LLALWLTELFISIALILGGIESVISRLVLANHLYKGALSWETPHYD